MNRKKSNNEGKQFVYILSIDSPKLQNILKIGETSRHPQVRAEELSKQTAALGRYIVEWYMEVPDSTLAEKMLHHEFSANLYNKEYYELDLDFTIKQSEKILNQHFKPIGTIDKYLRQKDATKFASSILNSKKDLIDWWENLPVVFKYAVFSSMQDPEGYIRLHIEKYVESKPWYDIRSVMLSRNLESFDEYPSEWQNEPHYGFTHIFEEDDFYITEMLMGAVFEDWWWFSKVFTIEHLHDLIEHEDLKRMYTIENIESNILVLRKDGHLHFPYLKD